MKRKSLIMILLSIPLCLASCGTSTGTSSVDSDTGSSSSQTTDAGSSSTSSHSGGPGGGTGGGGSGSGSATYGAATEITSTETQTDKSYTSSNSDESAILCKTANITGTILNPTVTKTGDTSSADNSSFYGQNASILATNGTLDVKGGSINSTASGAPGLCGYNDGVVNVADTSVTTTKN